MAEFRIKDLKTGLEGNLDTFKSSRNHRVAWDSAELDLVGP